MTWDAGLQPERAELAWRRTVLTVTAGTVIAARYLGQHHLVFGLLLPVVALCGGLLLLRVGTMRFRRLNRRLRAAEPSEPVMPGAFMLATLSAMVLAIALTSLTFILSSALSG